MASIIGSLLEQRTEWFAILCSTRQELKKFPNSSATKRRLERLERDLNRLDERISTHMMIG